MQPIFTSRAFTASAKRCEWNCRRLGANCIFLSLSAAALRGAHKKAVLPSQWSATRGSIVGSNQKQNNSLVWHEQNRREMLFEVLQLFPLFSRSWRLCVILASKTPRRSKPSKVLTIHFFKYIYQLCERSSSSTISGFLFSSHSTWTGAEREALKPIK